MVLLCMSCISAIASTEERNPSSLNSTDRSADGTGNFFPKTYLFSPILADPKEPRFFLGYRYDERTTYSKNVGVVGFGETFPFYRRDWGGGGDGWQVDVVGGAVARFVLENRDMIDADYFFGIPISWRWGNWSVRTRLYHESSHLGESVFIDDAIRARKKRTYDSVDLLSAYDNRVFRLYAGVEYMLSHYLEIEPWGGHLGAEYHGQSMMGNVVRPVAGVDVKAWEEYDYEPDVSIKAGLSFGARDYRQHHLQVMLEWYDGHANAGVFFEEEIRYIAVGLYFGY